MATCGVCDLICKDVSDVKCTGVCGRQFHLDCIKDDIEGRKTRSTKDWKCKSCRLTISSTRGGTASSVVSATLTKEFMEDFKKEVINELKKSFKKEIGELSTSVQFLSDKVDSANNIMAEIKTELAEMKKENERLRTSNLVISKQVAELQDRIRNLEQYSRRCNIEISGIPATSNEDVKTIVEDVGAAIGMQMQQGDMAAAHRIPAYRKDRIPSLVVQFSSKELRDTWLSKYKAVKTLTANQVSKHFPQQQRVYINEHLSPDNKVFLATLKKKCRDINYAFVWCRDGKFFIRKSEGSKVQRVHSLSELETLK